MLGQFHQATAFYQHSEGYRCKSSREDLHKMPNITRQKLYFATILDRSETQEHQRTPLTTRGVSKFQNMDTFLHHKAIQQQHK